VDEVKRNVEWKKEGDTYLRTLTEEGKVRDYKTNSECGEFVKTEVWKLTPLQAFEYRKLLLGQKDDFIAKLAELDRSWDQVKDKDIDKLKDSLDQFNALVKEHGKKLRTATMQVHIKQITDMKALCEKRVGIKQQQDFFKNQMSMLEGDLNSLMPLLAQK